MDITLFLKSLASKQKLLNEAKSIDYKAASKFNNWRFPTPEELSSTATNINYAKAKQTAKVIDLPASLYRKDTTKGGLFEPFTKKDIETGSLMTNAKRILDGFLKNRSMPYVTLALNRGKYEILDGNTRTGVAAPLGIKVKAIVITPAMYDDE